MAELTGILQEYVATANNPSYGGNWNIINSKFPELKNYSSELLQEYVATANNQEYGGNWDIINSKFPEFTTPKQEDYEDEVIVDDGTTEVEEEIYVSSDLVETEEEAIVAKSILDIIEDTEVTEQEDAESDMMANEILAESFLISQKMK